MLKGQAKTDYQRNYMRRLRLKGGSDELNIMVQEALEEDN